MIRKKLMSFVLAVSLACTLLAGCGSDAKGEGEDQNNTSEPDGGENISDELQPDEEAHITFFHIYNEEIANSFIDGKAMMHAISEFRKDYPNVEVEEIIVPSDWNQKLLTYSASGDMPDVYMDVAGTVLRTLINNESALPLENVFSGEFLSQFHEDALKQLQMDGHQYSLPLYQETGSTIVYNKELWKDAGYDSFPETWDEIIKANEYFKSQGISTIALGDQEQWIFRQCYFVTICNEFMGSEWFDLIGEKSQDVGYDNEQFIAALRRIATLGQLFNPDWKSIVDTEATNNYIEGKAASSINGNWLIGQIEAAENDYPGIVEKTGVAYFPGETEAVTTISGGLGCGVGLSGELAGKEGTVEYKAAVKLAEYITGEVYNIYTKENGGAPTMDVEADISSLTQLSQDYLEWAGSINMIPPFDRHFIDGQLDTVLSAVLQDVACGTMTPEEGAKKMQETYESLW